MSGRDIGIAAVMVIGLPLLMILGLSFLLRNFVALRSPPARRAAWTAGGSYLVVVLTLIFSLPIEWAWAIPLGSLPALAITFVVWRSDFRRAWIDDPSLAPEDAEFAEDDWRAALLKLAALAVLVIGAGLIRYLTRSIGGQG